MFPDLGSLIHLVVWFTCVRQGGTSAKDDTFDAAQLSYANEMLECLVWNPLAASLPRFSVACIPVGYEISNYDMLFLLGRIMEDAGSEVLCLTFDNATSHGLIKHYLLGRPTRLTQDQQAQLPFWGRIEHLDFPTCALPRFPFRRAMVDGKEPLFLGFPSILFEHFSGKGFVIAVMQRLDTICLYVLVVLFVLDFC